MAIGLNNAGTGKITLKAPDDCQYLLLFPNRPGNIGEVLTNDGQGNLVWTQGTFPVVSDGVVEHQQTSAVVWKWKIDNADNAFTITEEQATFGKEKNQTLVRFATLPGSALNPFEVVTRGEKTFTISADGLVSLKMNRAFCVGSFNDSDLVNLSTDVFHVFGSAEFHGTGSVTLPSNTVAEGKLGQIRFNSSKDSFEGFHKGAWRSFVSDKPASEIPTVEVVEQDGIPTIRFNVEHSDFIEYHLETDSSIFDFETLRYNKFKRIVIKLTHTKNSISVSWRPTIKWEDKRVPILTKLPNVTLVTLVTFDYGQTWYGSFGKH